jgi:hypothetical protein
VGEFIVGTMWVAFLGMLMWSGSSCQQEMWREDVIKMQGFCLNSKVSGQKFEKCYELTEKSR